MIDSIYFQISNDQHVIAFKFYKKGCNLWKDIWDDKRRRWLSTKELSEKYKLILKQIELLLRRMALWTKDNMRA